MVKIVGNNVSSKEMSLKHMYLSSVKYLSPYPKFESEVVSNLGTYYRQSSAYTVL